MLGLLIYYLKEDGSELDELDRFRCVGHILKKDEIMPLMHHKFLVACKLKNRKKGEEIPGQTLKLVPKKFWSGSYNFSKNAGDSLENVIIGRDKNLAESFFEMWERIYTISEPLESKNNNVKPNIDFDFSIFDFLKND